MRLFIRTIIYFILFISIPFNLLADTEEPNISETLFHHVLNSHDINIIPGTEPIQLPFGMTVHLLMLILAVVIIGSFFLLSVRKNTLKPKSPAVLVETLLLFVRDDIVYPTMGEERGEKWLPFFFTQFIFILVVNLLGLIPGLKTATGNINVTTAMAIMVFLLTFIIGIKNLGIIKFFKHFFPEGTNIGIGLFVALLELIGIFTKSIVLSLRLFANMFAGHLAILSFLVLMFVISPFFGVVSIPFAVFTYLLEVLIVLLQAFVFTLLSCIFITMSSSHE